MCDLPTPNLGLILIRVLEVLPYRRGVPRRSSEVFRKDCEMEQRKTCGENPFQRSGIDLEREKFSEPKSFPIEDRPTRPYFSVTPQGAAPDIQLLEVKGKEY